MLVASEDRVLLVRHTDRREWFLPGGTPDSGEPLATTDRREAKEETGVEVGSLKLLGIYSTLSQLASDHVAVFTGRSVTSPSPDVTGAASAEIEDVQWVSPRRLPEDAAAQTWQIIEDWRRGATGTYRVVD